MNSRQTRKTQSLVTKSMELGMAVPVVMAHRLTRMAVAGPTPSVRDRKEFELMSSEKSAAYAKSWQAMFGEMVRAQQALSVALMRSFFSPTLWGAPATEAVSDEMERAVTNVMAKGLAPVHRTAVANAQRLSHTPITIDAQ